VYYSKFVKHFAIISKLLTGHLKKNQLYVWTSDRDLAFRTLKSTLVQAPVQALPDFHKQFSIETDASDLGVGAVLMQEGHPAAFVSKALGTKFIGLSTCEKEYVAVLLAVEHWRSYLQFREFLICTVQKSLYQLNELNSMLVIWYFSRSSHMSVSVLDPAICQLPGPIKS
jgi:hypothetical protein